MKIKYYHIGKKIDLSRIFDNVVSIFLHDCSRCPLVTSSSSQSILSQNKTMERTYIMIKPDGVQRGLIGRIISRFEDRGYRLAGLKMLHAQDETLEEHYAELKAGWWQ